MSFPAGQHYVPEMLQKRFVDEDGMLWAFDKRAPHRGIWRSKPKGVFKERHLYTVAGPDGSPSPLIERALGQLESAADPIITRVVEQARAGKSVNLHEDERRLLILFLYFQNKRCPEFFRSIPIGQSMDVVVEDAIRAFEAKNGPMPEAERTAHLSPTGLQAMEQDMRMEALLTISPRVVGALDARGITIAVIPRADRRFVLSSLPIARFISRRGREDLHDPESEMWLPLAPDVALSSYGRRGDDRTVHIQDDRPIRQVNTSLARFSQVVASSSLDLVRSLTRRWASSASPLHSPRSNDDRT